MSGREEEEEEEKMMMMMKIHVFKVERGMLHSFD
jgi:hypothetical protein